MNNEPNRNGEYDTKINNGETHNRLYRRSNDKEKEKETMGETIEPQYDIKMKTPLRRTAKQSPIQTPKVKFPKTNMTDDKIVDERQSVTRSRRIVEPHSFLNFKVYFQK